MGTLYIDRRYSRLKCSGKSLQAHADNQPPLRVPLSMLERVVIHGNVSLDTSSLATMTDAGIVVTILCGRRNNRLAHVTGKPGRSVQRRVHQFQLLHQHDRRQHLVRTLLQHKLVATRRKLLHLGRIRPDLRRYWYKALQTVDESQLHLKQATSLERMRGLEGAVAAVWFETLKQAMPPELGFQGRRRRPPPDPVNAALSLGYTLLFSDAVQTLHAHGLDPWLGYLHEPAHGRESLAADLMEPMRLQVDYLVWRLFAQRNLRAEQFSKQGTGCMLNHKGRGIFFAAYERRARLMRRWLRAATGHLIHYLAGGELPVP